MVEVKLKQGPKFDVRRCIRTAMGWNAVGKYSGMVECKRANTQSTNYTRIQDRTSYNYDYGQDSLGLNGDGC